MPATPPAFEPLLELPRLRIDVQSAPPSVRVGRNVADGVPSTVRVQSSDPATVSVASGTVVIPARGFAAVSLTAGADGSSTVTVRANGYIPAQVRIRVADGVIVDASPV